MPHLDLLKARPWEADALTHCDVCIVGSGFAGSTIARELSNSGLRITLLESGGLERSPAADELNEVESVGWRRVEDQWKVRNRILGGTSHTWGGRCAPFQEIDFEQRSWVPLSQWPFGLTELEPFFDRSAYYLGLATGYGFDDDRFWRLIGLAEPPFKPNPAKLRTCFWQFSSDDDHRFDYMRLGPRLLGQLGANVTVVTSASVLRVNPTPDGRRVASVDLAAPDGSTGSLRAEAVVLCAGGVENPRLLLLSDRVTPKGLGNQNDLVGRYLMDHPRGPIASFDLAGSVELQRRIGRYHVLGRIFRGGFRLSPDLQRDEQLLNCSAWLSEWVAEDDPWEVAKRLVRGRPKIPGDIAPLLANSRLFAEGLYDYAFSKRGVARKLHQLTLDCMCEQHPDPDSRLTLSERRDRFGNRLPKIDWRIHPNEPRSMRRMGELLCEEFAAMGLPAPILEPWMREDGGFPSTFVDVAHPTGATRISADPATGVVDPNCQVHGVEGLYVAGSSTFPTAGQCNPTELIVALSIRLAEHLRAHTHSAPATTHCAAAETPTRVLVTGASGRIGRVVVLDLLERGYQVVATTSKEPPAVSRGIEWRRFDLNQDTGFEELVSGCDAVIHLAAELSRMEAMSQTNVVATRRLARAAAAAGVKAFCYTSSVAVYGTARAPATGEDAPVLTVERDVKSEYWGTVSLRAYGRTKLQGEYAIREEIKSMRSTIFRPSVVVDTYDLINARHWRWAKRSITAHRHAHHVYVGDVSRAIIWAIERDMADEGAPGRVELYNIAEDDFVEPKVSDFFRKAYAATGDRRFRVFEAPGIVDWLRDFVRFQMLPIRQPLWLMRFPQDKLRAAGFRYPFGMAQAHALALGALRREETREWPGESAAPQPVRRPEAAAAST